jgi:hypothetical protein
MLEAMRLMALVHEDEGQFARAEEIHKHLTEDYEEELGQDSVLTCNAVHDLGACYNKQGRLDDAERMFKRALQGLDKTLGPNNRCTPNAVHALAALRGRQAALAMLENCTHARFKGSREHWVVIIGKQPFGLMIEQGLFDFATERTVNEEFPEVKARTVKELVEAAWKA